jgi:hypothetical protein
LDYKPTICATPKKSLNDTERYTVLVVDEQSSYAKQLLGTVKKKQRKKMEAMQEMGSWASHDSRSPSSDRPRVCHVFSFTHLVLRYICLLSVTPALSIFSRHV